MPGTISIAGVGPGDPGAITLAATAAFARAERIILRTAIHPGLSIDRDPRARTCDDLYATGATFEQVYSTIVERVLEAARQAIGEIVYVVPGHPRFGERTVDLLLERAAAEGIPVTILPAVSYLDAIVSAIGSDPMADGLQLLDALDLSAAIEADPFSGGQFAIDPTRPLLVAQVYDRQSASAAKLRLARTYPDDHAVIVITAAGVPGEERISSHALFELDRLPVDHLTSVWLPPIGDLDAVRSPGALQRIAARLRRPDGCPWDRKQSHASLRQAVLEEAYEVVDAIDADDPGNLAEELGDLLLQVALHSQIAEEAGEFTLEDVYDQVNAKLVLLHPQVFG
ncbi:MAG: MazG nucleotide pyrophosphohydrolase domain-containing protein, partial [Thermomicrobiales bacterium]